MSSKIEDKNNNNNNNNPNNNNKNMNNNNNNNIKTSQKENNNNSNYSIRHSFINNPKIIKNPSTIKESSNLKSSSQYMISLVKNLEPKENKEKNNKNLECSFKDISQIEPNNNFILSEIENSLFNDNNINETIFLSKMKYSMPSMLNDSAYESIQLGEIYKEKIMNAKSGEEIILPEGKIIINYLIISHSIKIIGQTTSQIEITDGSIQININSNEENNNESVKINLVKIIFNLKDSNYNDENKKFYLFELTEGSLLELEDCDIVSIKENNKKIKKKTVAFAMYQCKVNNNLPKLISILTITNTRIDSFYQTIRAGENCIININKSAISNNFGKSIVMINPLIIKVNESRFEYNNCSVCIKYEDKNFLDENRQIFFDGNEFEGCIGSSILIESTLLLKKNINVILSNNKFNISRLDNVLLSEIKYSTMEIKNNIFENNKANGLKIKRCFNNEETENKIIINENTFQNNCENGLVIMDCIVEIKQNKFIKNQQSGLFFCNSDESSVESKKYFSKLQSTSASSNSIIEDKNVSFLISNGFWENGESGVKINNYYFKIFLEENIFKENNKHGIIIDLNYNENGNLNNKSQEFEDKIKNFQKCEQPQNFANLIISKCVFEKNMKSGIYYNNCLIYCEKTFIVDNLDYAIYTDKKDFVNCFKESNKSDKKNIIKGNIGGSWGNISFNSKNICSNVSCISCGNSNKKKKMYIEKKVGIYENKKEEKNDSSSYDNNNKKK